MENNLILVTPTYYNPNRLFFINECIKVFSQIKNLIWILCEDNNNIDIEVNEILLKSGIEYKYLAYGPTKDKGNEQRNFCYEYIVNNNINGIIYNADDDNEYDIKIFDEIKKTKNISIFPVGNLGPGIERPIIQNGKILRWDAGWTERRFPVDMGGFAFNSKYLYKKKYENKKLWNHKGIGGESEFINYITNDYDFLEFLCDNCNICYVKHNELHKKIPNFSHYKCPLCGR